MCEEKPEVIRDGRWVESLPACFALTAATNDVHKNWPRRLSLLLIVTGPQRLKVQPVKERLTDFPTESAMRCYHSCFKCRWQQVYSRLMSKSVTTARFLFNLLQCFEIAGILPLVEEFNETKLNGAEGKMSHRCSLKMIRGDKTPGASPVEHKSASLDGRFTFGAKVHSLHSTTQVPPYFTGGSLEDYRMQRSICAAESSLDDDILLIQQRALA